MSFFCQSHDCPVFLLRCTRSTEIGFWGIIKKVCIISLVRVAHFIDINIMRSGDVFRTAVALYYIGNEGISLLENFSRLGVVYPQKVKRFLKQLKEDNDDKEDKDDE